AASNGLTDVDLDCDEAIAVAPYMLKSTAVFGRKSRRASHWLYKTPLATTVAQAAIQFKDPVRKTMLVAIRIGGNGSGAQTVFPGSVHESGEPIRWESNGEPPTVEGEHLTHVVRGLAAATLLARYWPQAPGSRHDIALTLGGFLTGAGRTPESVGVF